jgi:hypothetical protein
VSACVGDDADAGCSIVMLGTSIGESASAGSSVAGGSVSHFVYA